MKIIKIVLSIINGIILLVFLLNLRKKKNAEKELSFKARRVNIKRNYIYTLISLLLSFSLIVLNKIYFSCFFIVVSIILLVRSILLKKEKIVIKEGFIYKYNLLGKEKNKYDIKNITKIEENNRFELTIYFNEQKINLYYDLDSYNIIKSMVTNYNIEYVKNTL